MNEPSQHSIERLKRQTKAWENHIDRFLLNDRQRFVEWLSQALDRHELALIVDAEVERRSLWETYLCERYGPVAQKQVR
jgi:hypothetical protein